MTQPDIHVLATNEDHTILTHVRLSSAEIGSLFWEIFESDVESEISYWDEEDCVFDMQLDTEALRFGAYDPEQIQEILEGQTMCLFDGFEYSYTVHRFIDGEE